MFCSKCGTELSDNAKFCTDCGNKINGDSAQQSQTQTTSPPESKQPVMEQRPQTEAATGNPVTKTKPTWKKVVTWAFLFIVGVIALATITTSGLMDPVDAHLTALRSGDVEAAYQHTSREFRANTSLPAYKKFVEAYPVLTKHAVFSMDERGFEGDEGSVIGHLLLDDEKYARIEFIMAKDDGDWKIKGVKLASVLMLPVTTHLSALRSSDIETAYQQTTKEFSTNTPLPAFKKFVEAYPVLSKHTTFNVDNSGFKGDEGRVIGHLLVDNKKMAKIEFLMAKESDEWKIQGMELKAPQ